MSVAFPPERPCSHTGQAIPPQVCGRVCLEPAVGGGWTWPSEGGTQWNSQDPSSIRMDTGTHLHMLSHRDTHTHPRLHTQTHTHPTVPLEGEVTELSESTSGSPWGTGALGLEPLPRGRSQRPAIHSPLLQTGSRQPYRPGMDQILSCA